MSTTDNFENEQTEETTLGDVANDVLTAHALLDDVRRWASETVGFLEQHAEEADAARADDPELEEVYDAICELMAAAHAVYLRTGEEEARRLYGLEGEEAGNE